MADENKLLQVQGVNVPLQQPQAQQNPLTSMSNMLTVAGQAQGIQQQRFQLGMAKFDAMNKSLSAIASMDNPSFDHVVNQTANLVRSGAFSAAEVTPILSEWGGLSPAQIKQKAADALQNLGSYQERMHSAYGQPGTANLGDVAQPTMTNVRSGAVTPAGAGLPIGMSPESKASRVNGVAGGVPFTAPQSSFVDRGGYALPAPGAPQTGAGAPATMAPRGVSTAPPPIAGPPAINPPGRNPDGTLPAPAPIAGTTLSSSLPPGAVQSSQGPGVDATANAQAVANQARAAALQEDAARSPDRKAALDRLQSYADTFTSGPASPYLKRAGGIVNQVAGAAGIEPPVKSQAAREAFDKDAAILAGQLSTSLGGTDASKVLASTMTPGASNTNEGIKNITGVLKGLEDAKTAKAQAWDRYRSAFPPGQADFGHFETTFNQTFSPRAFAMVYMSPAERQKTWNSMSTAEQAQVQRSYDAAKAAGYLKPPQQAGQ